MYHNILITLFKQEKIERILPYILQYQNTDV